MVRIGTVEGEKPRLSELAYDTECSFGIASCSGCTTLTDGVGKKSDIPVYLAFPDGISCRFVLFYQPALGICGKVYA